MKKSQKILWHILLWLLVFIPIPVALIIIFEQNLSKIKQVMPGLNYNLPEMIWSWIIALINFLIVFYVFYFIIHNLLKKGHINWRNILLTVSIFAVLVVQKWFWDFVPAINTKGLTFAQRFANITISICVFTVILTLIQGCIALGFKTILAYFDEKRKRKELETTNLKNELTMLRSQVNPHFL